MEPSEGTGEQGSDDDENDNEGEEEDRVDPSAVLDAPRGAAHRRSIVQIRRVQMRGPCDEHLEPYRAAQSPNSESKAFLTDCLKKYRFCRVLHRPSLEAIADGAEFFRFPAGTTVTTQREPGRYFFVVDQGSFEESVSGKAVGVLVRGSCFGGIALVYRAGRSATVVAKTDGSLWALDGKRFRHVLREHAKANYEESRQLLDQMSIFDGLPPQQKQAVGHLALFREVYEPGFQVRRCGEPPSAVYFVKSGELEATNAAGKLVQSLRAGDSFGWRKVVYGELEDVNVQVLQRSELVGVGLGQLERALGGNLSRCLIRSFLVSVLARTDVFSRLPAERLIGIAESMETRLYSTGERLQGTPVLAVVVDGEAEAGRTLKRGEVHLHVELERLARGDSTESELVAGPLGCRVAILHQATFASCLKKLGLPVSDDDQSGLQYIRKALFVRRVPIFWELSDEQVDTLVSSLVSERHPPHTQIFEQGSVGHSFYVVASGRVRVSIDGRFVRELGPGASFGERALLFNERRSATVEVLDEQVLLWSADRQAFRTAIQENMRDVLVRSINLYGANVTLKDLKHVRFIGAGTFGTVRAVEHKRTGVRYALKRIPKREGQVPPEVAQECALLAQNSHPFVLQYVDTFTTHRSVYILTELITGGQLHEQLLRKMGILPKKAAQFYAGSLALALEALHARGIIFRDLKPENVMLDQQGYIKLIDFGLAKKLDESTHRTYTVAGTVLYMAPEVATARGYGTECDVWSLGVVLFEFVTGQLPFGGHADDVQTIVEEIVEKPLEFPTRYNDISGKRLLEALLRKDPDQRLGAGRTGWTDIKEHKFFKQGICGNLFSQIAGREFTAPLIPEGEEFTPEVELRELVTESDAEELGSDALTDIGCRLLVIFQKFDLNVDGCIDRYELGTVLGTLDPETFTQEATDALFSQIDRQKRGTLQYDDFVAWVVNDKSASAITEALRSSIKLDARA